MLKLTPKIILRKIKGNRNRKAEALEHDKLVQERQNLIKERGIEPKTKFKQITEEDLTKIRKIIKFWAKSKNNRKFKNNNKKEMMSLLFKLDKALKRKLQKTEDFKEGLIISPILAYGLGEILSYSIKEKINQNQIKQEIIKPIMLTKKFFTDDIDLNKFMIDFLKYPKVTRLEIYNNLEKIFKEEIVKSFNECLRLNTGVNNNIAENSLKVHKDRLDFIKEYLLIEDNVSAW